MLSLEETLEQQQDLDKLYHKQLGFKHEGFPEAKIMIDQLLSSSTEINRN